MTSWKVQKNRSSKSKCSTRGSAIVEGILVIFILTMAVILNLELYRRINYETLLHHASFIRARDKVMGINEAGSKGKVCQLFEQGLQVAGQQICNSMELSVRIGSTTVENISEEMSGGEVVKHFSDPKKISGVIGKVYLRYPQLLKFRWVNPKGQGKEEVKSHLEITKECPYPTSSY